MIPQRPLDLLDSLKGKKVLVRLKNQEELVTGVLICFDIHINIVIDTGKLEFIKGENVISVC